MNFIEYLMSVSFPCRCCGIVCVPNEGSLCCDCRRDHEDAIRHGMRYDTAEAGRMKDQRKDNITGHPKS